MSPGRRVRRPAKRRWMVQPSPPPPRSDGDGKTTHEASERAMGGEPDSGGAEASGLGNGGANPGDGGTSSLGAGASGAGAGGEETAGSADDFWLEPYQAPPNLRNGGSPGSDCMSCHSAGGMAPGVCVRRHRQRSQPRDRSSLGRLFRPCLLVPQRQFLADSIREPKHRLEHGRGPHAERERGAHHAIHERCGLQLLPQWRGRAQSSVSGTAVDRFPPGPTPRHREAVILFCDAGVDHDLSKTAYVGTVEGGCR